jgi:hypothetical protein
MPWTQSDVIGGWFGNALNLTGRDLSLVRHATRVSVYNNTTVPNRGSQSQQYGVNPWNVGQIFSSPGWPSGGIDIPGGLTVTQDGADVVVSGAPVPSAGPVVFTPFGSLLYDRQAVGTANVAFCYHYFGGGIPAAGGQFIIVWAPGGIAVMTCPVTPRTRAA